MARKEAIVVDQSLPPAGWVVADSVIAAVAARAASRAPGVLRLETGVTELLRQLGERVRRRWIGIVPASTAGVTVSRDDLGVSVRVSLALAGGARAVIVAERVQQAVAEAVRTDTGVELAAVEIAILAIEPETRARVAVL